MTETKPTLERVASPDGVAMDLRVFAGTGASEDVYVCMPAMGVPAAYYDPFAAAVAHRGVPMIVAEHRATGTSSAVARRGVDFGYVDMITKDWPVVLDATRRRFPRARVHLFGHSLGGQLGALYLAMHPQAFESVMMVASCSVDFRGWDFPTNLRILAGTQLAGVVGRSLGYFPGHKLGFGGKQPVGVITDWARQGLTGEYRPRNAPIDFERGMRRVEVPVLAISIEGDPLAPSRAVDRLVRKLERAHVERVHSPVTWTRKQPNDAHFRWAREPDAIAQQAAAWIERLRGASAA